MTRLHQIRQKLNAVAPDMTISDDFFVWTMLKFARLSEEERSRVLTTTRLSWKITKVQNALVKLFPERQRFSRDDDDDRQKRGASRRQPFRDDRRERQDRRPPPRGDKRTDGRRGERRGPPRGDKNAGVRGSRV